ncbi:MAG: hypothetical protein KatS3mg077_0637 [Candidatus Binatia bacterium]|nr:MAG: hypothetical protein KatS3mg077_0637 [Candidatus Binatia bacterium]
MEQWVGVFLAVFGGAVGVILVVLGLPGPWFVCVVGSVFAWWTGFSVLGWGSLVGMAAVAFLSECLEFWLGAAAATQQRASWRVTVGAVLGGLLGALVGAPLLFGLGALFGSLAGSFVGAALAAQWEGASLKETLAVGKAAMKGRWWGFLSKVGATAVIAAIFLGAVIW